MKVVVLGTGATSGTLDEVGGVDGFVRRLQATNGNWEHDYGALRLAIQDCASPKDVGLDELWTRLDYRSKFKSILGSDYGNDAAIQIRKAIADAYSFRTEIERLCTSTNDFTLKRVLRELEPGDALISFNWDTLAETVLTDLLGRTLVQAPRPGASSHIRLIKPHGSLSWVHYGDRNRPLVFRDGASPLLVPMKSSEIEAPADGLFVQPLLLGALPIKSELLIEIQRGQNGLHETVADQWKEAVSALAAATAVDVVGYRFPPEDAYGRFLIREAIRVGPRTSAPKLRYFALKRDRAEFEKAFRDIFGSDVNYEYAGIVEPADVKPAG